MAWKILKDWPGKHLAALILDGSGGRRFLPEITTPLVLEPHIFRFGKLEEGDAAENVRALSEGQVMAMAHDARILGEKRAMRRRKAAIRNTTLPG